MTAGDHTTFRDEVGAYLLGALSDAERASFEGHLVVAQSAGTRSSACVPRPTCCRARSSR